MKSILFILTLSVLALPAAAQYEADVASEDAIIEALYEVISGPAGQQHRIGADQAVLGPHSTHRTGLDVQTASSALLASCSSGASEANAIEYISASRS